MPVPVTPDPATLTLAGVAVTVVTEGVKFLYKQAEDLLKLRRARNASSARGGAPASNARAAAPALTVQVQPPPAIAAGQPFTATVQEEVLEQQHESLAALRATLVNVVDGFEEFDPRNVQTVQEVDALRRLIEEIYGRPLTFAGERRADPFVGVEAHVRVEQVAGYVAAIRARRTEGNVRARAEAVEVRSGAQLVGIEADTVGTSPTLRGVKEG